MTKQLIPLIFSVCTTAFLLAACQTSDLDKQEPATVSGRAKIPYSLKVNTEATKVSYADETYQFKDGDKLHVVGITRTDIDGILEKNGEVWSGDLSYSTEIGKPSDDTELEVTLVHSDNPDTTSYASAIVGEVPQGTTLLQYAVEHYSWFTTQVKLSTKSATLRQHATFLDVTVTFDFDGSHVTDGGKAMVDLVTTRGKTTEKTDFIATANGEDFNVHFMAIIPGGNSAKAFSLTVGDREIKFNDYDKTLERNNKYTINRTIKFKPQLGDPYWSDGLYGRFQHADPNASIVGIIVYVNQDTDLGNAITERTVDTNGNVHYGHGLVMALRNVESDGGMKWSDTKGTLCTSPITKPAHTIEVSNLSGFTNTESIIVKLGEGVASAASKAKTYNVSAPKSTTGWFLPSIGQWLYTISEGFGSADPISEWNNNANPPANWLTKGGLDNLIRVKGNGGNSNNLLVDSLNERLETLKREFGCEYDKFGIPKKGSNSTVNYSDNYWSSSEKSANEAIRMNFGSVEDDFATIKAKPEDKTLTYFLNDAHYPAKVRPFLAF